MLFAKYETDYVLPGDAMIGSLKTRMTIMMLSTIIHAAVFCDYWLGGLWRSLPDSWAWQYTITLAILFIISLGLVFVKSKDLKWLLFLLSVLGVFVITVPFASAPGKFGLLYSFLIFQGFFYFNSYFAISLTVTCIVFSCWVTFLQLPLWTMAPKTIDISSLIFLWTQCLFTGGISYYLVQELKHRYQETKTLEHLKSSNQTLAETNIKLQNLAAQAELVTAIKERTRIAREIHDALAYTITNLLALLNAHREKIKAAGDEAPLELEQARILARDGLGDIRQVLRTLRPGDNEGSLGLAQVKHLVKVFSQATGIDVILNFGDVPQFLGETYEKVIYRIVQEGLTNAFRHGRASQILVSFCYFQEGIELTVWDNGCGAAAQTAGGFGLLGIKERVAELGGSVSITTQSGCGFKLLVKLPA